MRTIIGALVFVVMATACTTGTSTVEGRDVSNRTDVSEEVSDGTERPEEASDGTGVTKEDPNAELTLQDFIPRALALGEDNARQIQERERAAQEAIAACMAAEGFEYIPFVPNMDQKRFVGPETQEEFVAQYGFGISTTLLEDQRQEEDNEQEVARNPNNAITSTLSDSELEAYFAALHGSLPDFDPASMTEEEINEFKETHRPTGCYDTAYEDLNNDEAHFAFLEQFGTAMDEMYLGVESDARVREAESVWSTCMAKRGYDFANEVDIEDFIRHRLKEAGVLAEHDSDDVVGYAVAEILPDSPLEAALNEVASEEIALAKVSLACSADVDELRRQSYEEAERRFVQEHLAELEQFKKDHS